MFDGHTEIRYFVNSATAKTKGNREGYERGRKEKGKKIRKQREEKRKKNREMTEKR